MASTVDVQVPSVGESVAEASIGRWFFKDGEMVKKNEPLFELDSDKASMEVPAEESGKLEILIKEGETVEVGTTVARIDTTAEKSATKSSSSASSKDKKSETAKEPKKKEEPKAETKSSAAYQTSSGSRSAAAAKKTEPDLSDEELKDYSPSQRRAIRHGKVSVLKTSQAKSSEAAKESSTETRSPMSALRRTIANRLIHSQQSTATLTTFNEVDMSALLKTRSALKEKFESKNGVKLGFMSFFCSAIVSALKDYPIVNQYIDGQEIVDPGRVNIGIAVSVEKGLVVPVLRDVDQMSYAEMEKGILELAEKAREGKLSIPEMQGGSFTITNGGVFGSLLSTPILNPPQSGILGMHKTEHRPVAVEKSKGEYEVQVRPMMYLALSYDHRLIDGATSVGFLVKVKEYIESVTEKHVMA